eukprot:7649153-Karenia_brevis.AAC.1
MTAVADSSLSVVGQNMGGHRCVAGVANPFRFFSDVLVDALVCATSVADSALAHALTNMGGLRSVTPVADGLLF